ncbi:MAG: ester cyclase [Nitrososphaeraceae archaeon]
MSDSKNKSIARQFIEEIFNQGKIDQAKNFVTPDLLYHGAEEIRGIEEFKEWISEDRKAMPDMQVTILDDIEEQNKVALRWNLKATQEGEILGLPATHEKFETSGVEILHFEGGKIKEAWTVYDGLKPALQIGAVEIVEPTALK